MAESDIFVSNDVEMDVNFGEVFVIDQGVVYKIVASKYNNTATYVVGAYVLHLEKLYRCITAIEEPEEFDAEKWTQVLLANEVQIANANIALKANADDVYDKTAIDGKVSDINAAIALKANSADVYAKTETYNQTEVDNALATKADADTTYSKTEVDDALALKADAATTYNKTEVNNALATKADKATTYTKTEVDTALSTKADSSSVYSKSDTDTLLATKADVATTYTKTEVDNALANKANSADVYAKTETYSKIEIDTNIYTKTETYNKTEVDGLINNLPAPMVMKGTLGTGGTITDLPTASSENEGFTYKVITDGTYAGQAAKTGDLFTSAKPVGSSDYIWLYIPSGDETFTDTWRGIKVNGTEKLGSSINTGSVDFKNGTNSTVVFDSSDSSIKVDVDGYTQAQVDTKLSAKANSADVYAKSETYSASEVDTKLLAKANSSDVYTQAEVDTKLSGKANTSDVYTQAQIDTKLADKADKSTTYTKTEVDTALSAKANTTDVNTALDLKADKSDTYTKEEVDDKVDVSDTASGAVASFDDGSGLPFQEIKCEINAVQEGTPWIDSNIVNKEPYNYRAITGTASRIGNHLFDKLVGGTVAWNQLVDFTNSSIGGNYRANNTFEIQSINNTSGTTYPTINLNWCNGHKYLGKLENALQGGENPNVRIFFDTTYTKFKDAAVGTTNTFVIAADYTTAPFLAVDASNAGGKIRLNIFDLTAMFGSTIADYIYSLEQATAGSGVNFFRKLFPDSYYAYNAGSLKSVKTTAHKMVGKNSVSDYEVNAARTIYYDCLWVDCELLPNTTYTLSFDGTNGNRVFTNDNIFTIPTYKDISGRTVVQVTTKADISKSIASQYTSGKGWRFLKNSQNQGEDNTFSNVQLEFGSQATAYEPYTEHNYTLDDVELRGLFKLDSNNKLYADGDTYESSGDVTRKYQIITITGANIRSGGKDDNLFRCRVQNLDYGTNNKYKAGLCASDYIVQTSYAAINNNNMSIALNNDNSQEILIHNDAFTITDDVRAALNAKPIVLLYPLATPTTETADPFTNPQQVDANGTEEYIDSRSPAIPVGHETYYADIYDISGFTSCKLSVADGEEVERKSATIAFGQTVYGGILEYKNGAWQFTGTKQLVTYTGSENWQYNAGYVFIEIDNNFMSFDKIDCNIYKGTIPKWYSNVGEGEVAISLGSNGELTPWINIHNSSYKNVDEFKSDISNKNMQIIYTLATPFTLTLTGAQLETLLGENRVSHNCNGDTEVKYIRQTDLLDSIEFVHTQLSPWFELVATLTAGSTSLVFTNSAITANSTIDPYVDDSFYGVSPTAVVIANGSVTLTFNAQANDIPIKVRIS